jgi:hypothetical protein
MNERSSTAQIKVIFPESSVHFEIAANAPME